MGLADFDGWFFRVLIELRCNLEDWLCRALNGIDLRLTGTCLYNHMRHDTFCCRLHAAREVRISFKRIMDDGMNDKTCTAIGRFEGDPGIVLCRTF